jgi:putative SOS response-associated peptidase YedK
MCGRYSFVPTEFQLKQDLGDLEKPTELQLSYNIAPTQQAYVITNDEPGRLQAMQWGLIPCWSKDGANSGKLINARSEGLPEKPSFRAAFKRRRCLVPADSFYEWRDEGRKRKTPYRILRPDGHLLFFAGLWDEWRQDELIKRTFTIVTTSPSADVLPLHDRMPVILSTEREQHAWLENLDPEASSALLHAAPERMLRFYRVPEEVNSPGNNGPHLHEAVPEDGLVL